MKAMNQRQSRVSEEVRHAVAAALLRGDLHSTLPLSRLTVMAVWVSADLRQSRIYLALPEGMDEKTTLATANTELAGPMRKVLASKLASKYIPSVAFFPAEADM